jgi:flagellar basal-body rod protein FlgC
MSFWDTLRIGASGLSAQHLRLDVISNNIANAETTRTESGGPYQRQDVVFEAKDFSSYLPANVQSVVKGNAGLEFDSTQQGGVKVTQVTTDTTPGQRVYDPTHPNADADGYVTYPNVDLVTEMTNMISASRSYEANLSVIDAAKSMATKALDIGK